MSQIATSIEPPDDTFCTMSAGKFEPNGGVVFEKMNEWRTARASARTPTLNRTAYRGKSMPSEMVIRGTWSVSNTHADVRCMVRRPLDRTAARRPA